MFSCNRYETRKILENKAVGVVRKYDPKMGCPHTIGSEIVLVSKFMPGFEGQSVPFAKAQIVSVRPGTAAQFRKDDHVGQMDGYSNAAAWWGYFSGQMYKGTKDSELLHHIQFRVTEVEKHPKVASAPSEGEKKKRFVG